jgi:probable rRNA maturation factor
MRDSSTALCSARNDKNGSNLQMTLRITVTPRISVHNLQRKIPVNVTELQNFAAKALGCCLQLHRQQDSDLSKLHEVFVWLISDRRMASLHRKFMHQTGPTDVVTFQHGEIFISVETAKRHGRAFGNSLASELRLYIAHGLLHLHGFDDRTQAGARKMKRMQEKILRHCSGALSAAPKQRKGG